LSQSAISTSPGIGILKAIFSFPVSLAGTLVVLATLTVRARFDDPDMWWHLKTGEFIWTTHTIPRSDYFSSTALHQPWIPHEWLSEVTIYGAFKLGGLSGLMGWLCVLTSVLLIAGYWFCSAYSGNAKVGFMGAVAIWLFGTAGFAVRPQMIGYCFLILELLLIHLGRTRNPNWFFCLPPLLGVWINCHGSFSLGIALAAIFLFSSFFEFRLGLLVAHRWEPRCRRLFILALVLSVAALFLNPVGLRQVLYPFAVLRDMSVNVSDVSEWQPLQLANFRGIAFLGVIGLVFLTVIMRKAELFWDELLLLMAGIWLAAQHDRLIFVFGILTAPVLSRLLSDSWEGYDANADRAWPNALLIGVSLLIAFLAVPNRQNLEKQVEAQSPVKALEFIRANHLIGPMLNEWVSGGYLMWAAPEYPVFIDGRGDPFVLNGVFGDFGNWAMLRTDPNKLLEKYHIQFCLVSPQSPMVQIFPLLPNWKSVYADDHSVVFVRTSSTIPAR